MFRKDSNKKNWWKGATLSSERQLKSWLLGRKMFIFYLFTDRRELQCVGHHPKEEKKSAEWNTRHQFDKKPLIWAAQLNTSVSALTFQSGTFSGINLGGCTYPFQHSTSLNCVQSQISGLHADTALAWICVSEGSWPSRPNFAARPCFCATVIRFSFEPNEDEETIHRCLSSEVRRLLLAGMWVMRWS